MTDLKKEIQKILHPEYIKEEDLHPPRAPIVGETSVEDMSDFEKVSPQQTDSKPPKCEHRATYNDSRCVRCGEKVIKPPNTKAIVSEKSITMVDGATDKGHKPSKEVLDSTPAIDFEGIDYGEISKLATFRRFVNDLFRKYIPGFEEVNTRAKNKIMTQQINNRIKKTKLNQEIIKRLPPDLLAELKKGIKLVRKGSLSDMEIGIKNENELEEVLRKRNENI